MKVETLTSTGNPANDLAPSILRDAGLVYYFMSPDYAQKEAYLQALKKSYPTARFLGCTTGGEIVGNEALHGSCVSAAVTLEQSRMRLAEKQIGDISESYNVGMAIAEALADKELRLIFVLSDGLKVNGSDLVKGITDKAGKDVIVTGGLAGDGHRFQVTGVGLDGVPEPGRVVAAGFYGDKLRVSYGSIGGWEKFGPERVITRSVGNVLYELDGKPALDLYKKYLGEEAKNLPGSGLLFPLSIYPSDNTAHDIVRTIVGIDEKAKSLTFAGDIPQGYIAQLMCGNTSSLAEGAKEAAKLALKEHGGDSTGSLAILVSCIGRNLLMGQNVSNEIEAVKHQMSSIPLVGFYSYGEICHHPTTRICGLHNQTMTITLLSEAA